MESDHVTAGRTVVLDLTTDPDAVGITLGRFSEIERGEGPPAIGLGADARPSRFDRQEALAMCRC